MSHERIIINLLNLYYFIFADPSLARINPYIRHWEAARYDTEPLENAHRYHESRSQRRKRETTATAANGTTTATTTSSAYGNGPANTIKFSFFAHDR